jgi:hypothetical protein
LHGVHEPTTGNPLRRPRSARRTTSIDMTRDEGSLDPVYLNGRARDLWTAADGTVTELGSATLSATIELIARVVRHVEVTPPVAAMSRLAGAPAMRGFRAAADKAAPELRRACDLRYTLLDDVPVATLISGHALSASNLLGDVAKSGYLPVADQCAGFASGGLLLTSFEAGDPVIVTGPEAPDLDHGQDPGDPWAWHQVAALPRHAMRRRRRIDVHEEKRRASRHRCDVPRHLRAKRRGGDDHPRVHPGRRRGCRDRRHRRFAGHTSGAALAGMPGSRRQR